MKKLLKISFAVLASAMLFCALTVTASATRSGTTGEVTFSVSSGTLTISGTGSTADYTSTSLPPWNTESFTSVIIGEGVKGVGNYCFYGKTAVTNVSLPTTLKEIGNYAFAKTGISTVNIPESLTDMGYGAFNSCSKLSAVYFNAKNCKSANGANSIVIFGSTIRNIYLGSNVQSIGDYMFVGVNISTLNLPDNVRKIGTAAFYQNTNLISVNINSTSKLYSIGEKAFSKCTQLSTIKLPELVTFIGDDAFSGCASLKSLDLSYHVTQIGADAFASSGITVNTTTDAYACLYCKAYGVPCNATQASYGDIGGGGGSEIIKVQVNTNTALTVLNGKLDIYVNFDKELTNECVHVAFYNSANKVVDYMIIPLIRPSDDMNIVCNDVSSAAYAKIFVWDSLETLRPISPIERVEIKRP